MITSSTLLGFASRQPSAPLSGVSRSSDPCTIKTGTSAVRIASGPDAALVRSRPRSHLRNARPVTDKLVRTSNVADAYTFNRDSVQPWFVRQALDQRCATAGDAVSKHRGRLTTSAQPFQPTCNISWLMNAERKDAPRGPTSSLVNKQASGVPPRP